jgi:hypothetical protein
MEKEMDPWNEIADLINREKKRALTDFHRHEFVPDDFFERPLLSRLDRKRAIRPVFMAAAASVLLAVGLLSFWLLRSTWQKVPAAPASGNLLADSFLYGSAYEAEETKSEPRVVSSFSSAFSAWAAAAGWTHAAAPGAKPVDSSMAIEHGDPAAVQHKLEKMIRENSIERMLTRFCQICKEV